MDYTQHFFTVVYSLGMKYALSFTYEVPHWNDGFEVTGIDEVGRGALAGPVYAGSVCFPTSISARVRRELESAGVYDSKKLTKRARERAAELIHRYAAVGIGSSECEEINSLGIAPASFLAMRRAFARMWESIRPCRLVVYVDAFHIPGMPKDRVNRQIPIVKGDSKVFSIAAASIIAKVARDRRMTELAAQHPRYSFEENKGYGTSAHRSAIQQHGPCCEHRDLFVRKCLGSIKP